MNWRDNREKKFHELRARALPELATLAAGGNPLYSSVPILVASVCSIAFMVTAIWRFKREEF